MSSLVVFPFRTERPEVVVANVRTAASHDRVAAVACVGFDEEATFEALSAAAPGMAASTGTPIVIMLQERIGGLRPGKGDAMNTALRHFLSTGYERLLFYDADITSFDATWITRAQEAADLGYGVVRHYFPRASTDAMITWMVTRTGFAMLHPRSELAWIEQPLGGELLLTRPVVERLVADERVAYRSDWGIDTLLTFALVEQAVPMFETYMRQGKAHALYGSLADIRTMVVECFDAVRSLAGLTVPAGSIHRVEHPDKAPDSIATKVGYDVETTLALLTQQWTPEQLALLELFPEPVGEGMKASVGHPTFGFMTEDLWYRTMEVALRHFDLTDPDWHEVFFRLWTVRVLAYTTRVALRGYDYSQRALQQMIWAYLRRAALG